VGVGRMLVAMAFGFSLSGLPVAFAPDELIWYGVAIWGLLLGFCGVGWNINQVSLRQAITQPRMQGRMNATMRFIVWGTMPIGAILGGALGSTIGLHPTIVIGALGGLVAFLPVTLSSVRHIVTMPEPVDDEAPPVSLSASA
jgi:MFS family permease